MRLQHLWRGGARHVLALGPVLPPAPNPVLHLTWSVSGDGTFQLRPAESGRSDSRIGVPFPADRRPALKRDETWTARFPPAPTGSGSLITSTTLMIVDDSPAFLASAGAMLGEEGFEVVGCVSDAERAV